MSESQQSQRGWLSSWRERRAAKRQERVERARFDDAHDSEPGGGRRHGSANQHTGAAMWFGGGGYGGDGGGCGGGDGGGGC